MKQPFVILLLVSGLALFLLAGVVGGLIWLYVGRVSKNPPASILLTSKDGRRLIGDQLQFFDVASDGTISANHDAWLGFYYTEGKPFRVSGEVLLGTRPNGTPYHKDFPDGFALFLREWDSLHRYTLNSRFMQTKRRRFAETEEPDIVQHVAFQRPPSGVWLPFTALVTADQIAFQIGPESGVIPGPLAIDGANKLLLGEGSRVKNLCLEFLAGK